MQIHMSNIKQPQTSLIEKINLLLKDVFQASYILPDLDPGKSPSFSIKLFLPLNSQREIWYFQRLLFDFDPKQFWDSNGNDNAELYSIQASCLFAGFKLISIDINKEKMGLEIEVE